MISNQGQTDGKFPLGFLYEYLRHNSGPSGVEEYDLNTSSAGTDSVFEYVVPAGRLLRLARFNMVLVDDSISPGDFGGIVGGGFSSWLFI